MKLNSIKSAFEFLFSDKEYEELRSYIPDKEVNKINKTCLDGHKIISIYSLVTVGIGICIELFVTNNEHWVKNTWWLLLLWINSLVCLYVLLKKPESFKYIVPINIVMYQLGVILDGLSFSDYRMIEYVATNIAHFCCQVLTAPSNWKLNCAAFTITSALYNYLAYTTYDDVPKELFLSTYISILFFNGFAFLSNSKIKELYALIVKNVKLIEEINKIIQAFPHAVLIQSESEWYTNFEFEKVIKKINKNIDELQSVKVKIDDNGELNNLRDLLRKQVDYLKKEEVKEEYSVLLKKQIDEDNENELGSEHFCNIKSMKVLWKGKPSFMHVFIDTSNILKLKEANDNITWQRIMFASTSHEFRTPLNAIMNSWKFVKTSFKKVKEIAFNSGINEDDKPEFAKNSQIIEKFISIGLNSSELLLSLVEDVLNLSKINAEIFTIQKDLFNIKEMVHEVVDLFKFQCEAKKINLVVDLQQSLQHRSVFSDKQRIKQTLINLVGNSYKFTFEGHIAIKIKASRLGLKSAIEFRVEDTGVGISEQDKSKLFTLFGMLDTTKNINPNGCGIGLTVSKKYVNWLGGELNVESELGKGTTMVFVLPDEAQPSNSIVEELKENINKLAIPFFGHNESVLLSKQKVMNPYCVSLNKLNENGLRKRANKISDSSEKAEWRKI
jgi:signal transduction histidine kinase